MRDGGFQEGKACLRAKIDMASPFMVMRNPVIYRIKFATHHQSGDKWCIYPMYDFTHCISDALKGSLIHSVPWNSRITAVCMTGFWITSPSIVIRVSMNSHA
ncbi:glutamate--tRNA ligase family protein [Shigella flexneri]